MKAEEINFAKHEQYRLTMLPARFAIWLRTCVLYQAFRFMVINIKMLMIIRKSH